jgi:hypothetical protein
MTETHNYRDRGAMAPITRPPQGEVRRLALFRVQTIAGGHPGEPAPAPCASCGAAASHYCFPSREYWDGQDWNLCDGCLAEARQAGRVLGTVPHSGETP